MANNGQGAAAKVAPTAADLAQRFLTEHADVKRKASMVREDHPLFDHVIVPAPGRRVSARPQYCPAMATWVEKVLEGTILRVCGCDPFHTRTDEITLGWAMIKGCALSGARATRSGLI
jgi:hypothetical protein